MVTDISRFKVVSLPCPEGVELIAGHGFFSPLTIEELFRAVAIAAPSCKFGAAMVEGSSGVVRKTGNSSDLVDRAASHALAVKAGHFFTILIRGAYPTQVVNSIKQLPSVVALFCATGNPVSMVVVDTDVGSAVVGVIDGGNAQTIETQNDIRERRRLLRRIGYLEQESGQ
jgi:adenosine/AMP kinase